MRKSFFKGLLLSVSNAETENNGAFTYLGCAEWGELAVTSDLCSKSQSQLALYLVKSQ